MDTKLTRKFIAEVASLVVFGVGLAGVYILAKVLKDEAADLTIALIATASWCHMSLVSGSNAPSTRRPLWNDNRGKPSISSDSSGLLPVFGYEVR